MFVLPNLSICLIGLGDLLALTKVRVLDSGELRNEPSDQLTKFCVSEVRVEVQTKMGFALAMFGVAVKLIPNFAAASLRRVLHRLQHKQPTMFHRRQLLGALHTEL